MEIRQLAIAALKVFLEVAAPESPCISLQAEKKLRMAWPWRNSRIGTEFSAAVPAVTTACFGGAPSLGEAELKRFQQKEQKGVSG